MKKLMMIALAAGAAAMMTGCQTRITAEKFAEQVLPIQQKVTVNGEDRIITTHYQIASGGWYATARSPLYATEALEGLDIGVHTNGSVTMSLNKYSRDLSTNSVMMVDGLMRNGANLVTAIGEAYVKIAGGGAQAETVLTSAQKIYSFFTDKGGDASKAKVTAEDGKVKVSDGTTCVTCDKDGNCTACTDCTVTDGGRVTIDTDKIVAVAQAIYAHCCMCEKTGCGDCLYRQVLDACGTKVPEHPMADPF